MTGRPLPDEDHVARYCKPSSVDTQGRPMASAFALREGEDHFSANWLEYFDERDQGKAVARVRQALRKKGYRLRPNGRLAVLDVGFVKAAVQDGVGLALDIRHCPLDDDDSHAGIFGYGPGDLAVAIEMQALAGLDDGHGAAT